MSTVRGIAAFLIAATMAAIAAGSWAWLNQPQILPDAPSRISGFAYSGYQRNQDPNAQAFPSAGELIADLALMARQTDRIRTYSSIDNASVPRLAADQGLFVTAGAWLDKRAERNENEIAALIRDGASGRFCGSFSQAQEPAAIAAIVAAIRKAAMPRTVDISIHFLHG